MHSYDFAVTMSTVISYYNHSTQGKLKSGYVSTPKLHAKFTDYE